ncbi:hypothetical protein APHAL10511_008058 [Amanita phalloides]|nr:hypothetical protein APHAL10511_008058 [Amanita phalloides]
MMFSILPTIAERGLPLSDTMGVMLIITLVSAVLHGITVAQAHRYFTLYSNDILYLKVLVTVLVVVDATHLSMAIYTVYHYLIRNFYNPAMIGHFVWSVTVEAICTSLNSSIVQFLYALWVWRLSKNKLLLFITITLVLLQGACNIAWVIISTQIKVYSQLIHIGPLTMTMQLLSALIDVINAVSFIVLLRRSRSGFIKSDSLINKMIFFVLSTGLLTSLYATAVVVLLIATPRSFIAGALYLCVGRLYVNSFIAALNARRVVKQEIGTSYPQFTSAPDNTISSAYASSLSSKV